jgi:protocadherin Fat 4
MPSYFTLNSNTGQISVRASLTAEIRDSYQGRIVAFDGGSPPRSATAIATINIQRNLNSPIFNPSSYEETILETLQAGTSIVRVTASDADRSVSV